MEANSVAPAATTAPAHADPAPAPAAATNTFTVSGTGTAPPAPVRRGRGNFGRQLRTEDIEKQQQQHLLSQRQAQRDAGDAESSVMTSATSAVVLQPTTMRARDGTALTMASPEDEAAAPNAQAKRNIPLDMVYSSSAAAVAAAAAAAAATDDPRKRELFGVYHDEVADTTKQIFFRGEKRRRYCMIVGNLQSTRRLVNMKLFGHRGLKPFKLQGKMIRLINLSVSRPRVRRALLNPDGTQRLDSQGHVIEAEFDDDDDDDGYEEAFSEALLRRMNIDNDNEPNESGATVKEGEWEDLEAKPATPAAAAATTNGDGGSDESPQHRTAPPPPMALGLDDDGNDGGAAAAAAAFDSPSIAEQRRAHEAAGFPAEDFTAAGTPMRTGDSTTIGSANANGSGVHAPAPAFAEGGSRANTTTTNAVTAAAPSPAYPTDAYDQWLGEEEEDVDHYFERDDDEVVPLTVQRVDDDDDGMDDGIRSLANSPVLTSKFFSSLTDYFLREFRFLLCLEDVRQQNVSVNVNLGAAYCCLARHGSHSTPLKHATFSQFVERMNDESMQLYFIKDCPACVSRAVDRECGALDSESAITVVKIYFFSNERQSRTVARAVWDSEKNAFKLLDMENIGVSFNWAIFSLDETLIRQRTDEAMKKAVSESPSAEAAAAAAAKAARAKTVAYPFEVEFRAFRRWRQHADHPAAPLAEAILELLSTAEHGLISHGSSAGYEHLDLSNICELDYAADDINVESITVEHTARVKPQGTDLMVDNTTSLFIENFAAARDLKEQIARYGPAEVAARQSASNNNFYGRGGGGGGGSSLGLGGGIGIGGGGGGFGMRGASRGGRGRGGAVQPPSQYDLEMMESVLRPASKLTFFRSRGSTIHWKFKLNSSVEENIAPMAEALRFVQQVLVTANDIERNSDRGGAAPEAL